MKSTMNSRRSRAVLCGMLAATLAAGSAAYAQPSRQDRREDARDARRDMRDNRRDMRDHRRDMRDDRRELRDDRRDMREGRQDRFEERRYYNAHEFRRGGRLPPELRHRQYVVSDWRGHHLSPPPRGYEWVQVGPDYVLVAIATGLIANLILSQ